MKTVRVNLPDGGYDIIVGSGVSRQLPQVARQAGATKVVLITDAHVAHLHAPGLLRQLESEGLPVTLQTVPAGEASKAPAMAAELWEALAEAEADRQTVVVALGGGVVGDLAGFVAATFARGLPYVQVPTTLVGMVDSAIGGKAAINLTHGKNLVGAFHHPRAVLADLDVLSTLPATEYENAWAEVIKCAIIADAPLLDTLVTLRARLLNRDRLDLLEEVIARCARIKARVVAGDPNERGARAMLNYGHTLGHALEAALGYGSLSHGRAVAWGMVVAGQVSVRLGTCASDAAARQDAALGEYSLLARPPRLPTWEALAHAMARDKKRMGRQLHWVLLEDIGRVRWGQIVPEPLVQQVIEEVFARAGARDSRP